MGSSIIDLTILPSIAAAVRYAANLIGGMVRRGPATPAADSQPDVNHEATSNSSETSSSSTKQANTVLNELDDRFVPTINAIILARDKAEKENRPIPPAWSRLRRPADILPLNDEAANNALDQLNDRFLPTIRRRQTFEFDIPQHDLSLQPEIPEAQEARSADLVKNANSESNTASHSTRPRAWRKREKVQAILTRVSELPKDKLETPFLRSAVMGSALRTALRKVELEDAVA
ncbi:hypothetical protein F4782DRAFT_532395 [Xylaria castorea]|nr:hypothetical protein F4782DRAFT_532395 [Xylaria castorea]